MVVILLLWKYESQRERYTDFMAYWAAMESFIRHRVA